MSKKIENILDDRGSTYGGYCAMATLVQSLKKTMHESGNWDSMPPWHKESLDVIATKIGRILTGDCNHLDSWKDIEGYARLISDRLPEEE